MLRGERGVRIETTTPGPTPAPAIAQLLDCVAAPQSSQSFFPRASSRGWGRTMLCPNPRPGPLVGTSHPASCLTLFEEDTEGQNILARGTQLVSG